MPVYVRVCMYGWGLFIRLNHNLCCLTFTNVHDLSIFFLSCLNCITAVNMFLDSPLFYTFLFKYIRKMPTLYMTMDKKWID